MHLITGKKAEKHINSVDDRAYHAWSFGAGNYVLHGCECAMTSANNLHIEPGELLFEGSIGIVEEGGEDVSVPNGTNGMNRIDLVVIRYTMDAEHDNIEDSSFVLIRGEAVASGNPVLPEYEIGSALSGSLVVDYPFLKIPVMGVNVGEPELLFKRTTPYEGHTHNASEITEGVLDPEHGGTGGVLPIKNGGTGAGSQRLAADSLSVQSISRGRILQEKSNLNSLTTPGNYVCQDSSLAETFQNCPVKAAFRLTVWDLAGGVKDSLTKAQELFVVGSFRRYKRTYVNNEWSEWSYDLTSGESIPISSGGTGGNSAVSAVNALKVKSLANGVLIGENANLNSYITPGNYVCASSAVAETVTNKPSGSGSLFRVYVYDMAGASVGSVIVGQELVNAYNGRRFYRYCNIGTKTWGEWSQERFASDLVDIAHGGTGANSRAKAIGNLTDLGSDPVSKPADDTLESWKELGCGIAWFTGDKLKNQPNATGSLFNFPKANSNVVTQIFHSGTQGDLLHRGIDADGLGSWHTLLNTRNTKVRIVETSSSGNWLWFKYNNGWVRQICRIATTMACGANWGNGFYNPTPIAPGAYPIPLKANTYPRVQASVISTEGRYLCTLDTTGTLTTAPKAYICSMHAQSLQSTVHFQLLVEGWSA